MNSNERKILRAMGELSKEAVANPQIWEEIPKETQDFLLGSSSRFWTPPGIWRKVAMFSLLTIGLFGIILMSWWFALLAILAVAFSPRLTGELATLSGYFARGYNQKDANK